jgi:hypothetical protein
MKSNQKQNSPLKKCPGQSSFTPELYQTSKEEIT